MTRIELVEKLKVAFTKADEDSSLINYDDSVNWEAVAKLSLDVLSEEVEIPSD